ncbi:hypothetical protein LINPERHAP1_LOCUS8082 [Linum perenne]
MVWWFLRTRIPVAVAPIIGERGGARKPRKARWLRARNMRMDGSRVRRGRLKDWRFEGRRTRPDADGRKIEVVTATGTHFQVVGNADGGENLSAATTVRRRRRWTALSLFQKFSD